MRILFLNRQLALTGAPSVGLSVLKQRPAGTEVMIVSELGGAAEKEWSGIGPLKVVDRSERPAPCAGPKALLRYAFDRFAAPKMTLAAANREAHAWKPDIVYANSAGALRILADVAPRNVPAILHVHEIESALAEHTGHSPITFANRPTRYIAVSDAAKASCIANKADPTKIVVIPPCYDEARYPSPQSLRRRTGAPLHVGGVGGDYWRKGITLWLLMAAEMVAKMGRDAVKFTWVGTIPTYTGERPEEMIRKLNLTGVVELVPATPNIDSYLSSFDVLALSSWEESASIVSMECMALGVPVACFAGSGGPAEIIGDAGIVIGEFSPAKMADAIIDLAASGSNYEALSALSIERARTRYTSAIVVPQIWQQIESLVQGDGG